MHFKTLQRTLFLALLATVTIVFVWVIYSYLFAIFWALVIAIVFYPFKKWLEHVLPLSNLVSTIMTMISIVVIVLVPVFFLGNAIISEAVTVYQQVVRDPSSGLRSLDALNRSIPVFSILESVGISPDSAKQKALELVQTVGRSAVVSVASFGQHTLRIVVNFFIMLYVLFYFLQSGPGLLKQLQHLIPLGDTKERRLFTRFSSTVRATVKGTLIIGLIQGMLGGVLFWLVGIQAPVLWGGVMTVLSIIPAVGSFIVWAPAGIILLFTGSVGGGLIVLIAGAAISSVDNVIRPVLVGKDTQMPDVMILLSTLGGLSVFGISGFVIGPVIAAFFLALWTMFDEQYGKELQQFG